MKYEDQTAWQEIQSFLPPNYRLAGEQLPTEEWWSWKGHRVHLDCFRNPQSPVKVILFHGVGTNGRQMSTILGGPLARSGIEAISIDMPGYGATQVRDGSLVRYDDWVSAGEALVETELAKDARPIYLYGLSAGGMLAYHVAAKTRKVKGIIGMTFLDQREAQVRKETTLHPVVAVVGIPLVHLAARTPLAGLRMPMGLAAKMYTLVNDKRALKAFTRDNTSAGNWVSMAFLSSYMNYVPVIEPEDFTICPILLTQPAEDRWTPLHLSELFLKRANKVRHSVVTLEGAGHYPLEQPGLDQMVEAIQEFIRA